MWAMNKEKLTIITVCFNSAETLAGTLQSVASQKSVVPLHYVQDGGSVDGTEDLVAQYDNVKFISQLDDGVYCALNIAISAVSDGIIGILHADDFYPDDAVLERVMQTFADDPSLVGVYGDLNYVSSKNVSRIVRYWHSSSYRQGLLRRGWMPPHPTLFLRHSVYEEIGGFDLKYKISADFDFIMRTFERFGDRISYIPSVLVHMRTGGLSNGSLRNVVRKTIEDFKIALKMGWFAPIAVLMKNVSKLSQISFFGRRS